MSKRDIIQIGKKAIMPFETNWVDLLILPISVHQSAKTRVAKQEKRSNLDMVMRVI